MAHGVDSPMPRPPSRPLPCTFLTVDGGGTSGSCDPEYPSSLMMHGAHVEASSNESDGSRGRIVEAKITMPPSSLAFSSPSPSKVCSSSTDKSPSASLSHGKAEEPPWVAAAEGCVLRGTSSPSSSPSRNAFSLPCAGEPSRPLSLRGIDAILSVLHCCFTFCFPKG